MQISVISPSWCAWIVSFLSLVPMLSQHKAMFTYLKQSQTFQCQTIPYHFCQSINHPLIYILVDAICESRLIVYATVIMAVMGAASIIFLLFQTGGCFMQVILYKAGTGIVAEQKRGGCL